MEAKVGSIGIGSNKDQKPVVAEHLPGVALYEDYRELPAGDVEAVIIAVPHPLHGDLVIEDGKLKWWRLQEDERAFCKSCPISYGKIPFTYEKFDRLLAQRRTGAVSFANNSATPNHSYNQRWQISW